MARYGKLTYAQKQAVSATGLLMQRTRMVYPGARIAVAASGGADSFALLKILTIRKAIMPFDVELMALHVNPGFEPDNEGPLLDVCRELGVAVHTEQTDHGPRAHSEENRKKSPCFYCAMQRRKRLFELCRDYGMTHLALGHNTDDLTSTFFMNLLHGGRVEGMSACEPFFGGALTVIRPCLLVDKATLERVARQWGLPVWKNPCPSSGDTKRDEVLSWLAEKWSQEPKIQNNIKSALKRFQLDAQVKRT